MKKTQNDKVKFFNDTLKKVAEEKNGIEEFYELYGGFIYETAKLICRDTYTAKSVLNQVLTKVWKLSKAVTEVKNPEGFLYRITVNTEKDSLKERRLQPFAENIVIEENDFQKILDDDEFYCLIKGLTESLQELMSYKFIQNMTFEEIAETMDKPVSTITSLYYRGLKKIKENLKI